MNSEQDQQPSLENSFIAITAGLIAGAVAVAVFYFPVFAVAITFHEASLLTQLLIAYPVMLMSAFLIMLFAAWACAKTAVAKERQHATVLWIIGLTLIIIPLTDLKSPTLESVATTVCIALTGGWGLRTGVKIAMKRKRRTTSL